MLSECLSETVRLILAAIRRINSISVDDPMSLGIHFQINDSKNSLCITIIAFTPMNALNYSYILFSDIFLRQQRLHKSL